MSNTSTSMSWVIDGSSFLSAWVVSKERMNASMSLSIPGGIFIDGP